MASVFISKLGKMTLHCVNPGATVNGECYRNQLQEMMLPEMRILAGGGHVIFQQDGARAHTAKDTVAYIKDNGPAFTKQESWPPKSPMVSHRGHNCISSALTILDSALTS